MVEILRVPALALLLLGACQHQTGAVAAQLVGMTPESSQAIQAALAKAVGQAEIELGAGLEEGASTVTVLPPPLTPSESRSPALPIVFDLFVRGDTCFAVQRENKTEISLPGISCRPA